MAAENKKDFFENWEVAIGGVIRPRFRDFCRGGLDQLRQAEPDLWLATAWMYKRQPASMQSFRVLLLGTATAGERVLGWIGNTGGVLGQIVDKFGEQMLEDLDGNLTDYFRDQPDDIFVGYNGPRETELKDIATRLQKYLKTMVKQFAGRLPSLTIFRKDNLFGNPGWELAQTLLIQPEPLRLKFLNWYDQQDDRMKDRIRRVTTAINNTGEFCHFITLETEPDDLMAAYVNHVYENTRAKLLTEEEFDDVSALYARIIRNPASEAAERFRAESQARELEMVGKYAASTPPFYQGGFLIPIALAVFIIGGGSFWVGQVAKLHPSTQPAVALPTLLSRWIPTQPMGPVEPSTNWWGLSFGIIALVVLAVLVTIRIMNNRRAN